MSNCFSCMDKIHRLKDLLMTSTMGVRIYHLQCASGQWKRARLFLAMVRKMVPTFYQLNLFWYQMRPKGCGWMGIASEL